jgi:acid phosphatase family membrane protein YuiD
MNETHASIWQNIHIWSAVFGWLVAQVIKMMTTLIKTKKLDWSYLMSTGGMPSAHSAFACALATSTGLAMGFNSAVFAVAFAFACIVMFDAQSVRRAAGKQASILNQIIEELFKEHHLSEHKLAELLGHSRPEVGAGLLTGVLIALLVHAIA